MLGGIKIDRADQLFSLWIRARAGWRCERCGKSFTKDDRRGLEASHFWGRRNESVRYDPENVFALDTGCHMYFTANPHEHREWVLAKLGKTKYDALTLRANAVCKVKRKQHRKEQAAKWKQALKDIGIDP